MPDNTTSAKGSAVFQPRRPTRSNGRLRYEQLLDAAERLLALDEEQPLAIQKIAREAGVPMASVYHFLPHPAAVSVALAERYMVGFQELVERPIPDLEALDWRQLIGILQQRAVQFYREHPYAQKLILGSDHSWTIRQSDLANNRRIAAAIAGLLADKFPDALPEALFEAVVVGISVGDAVFVLSIAEHGAITPTLAVEATVAVCAYIGAKFDSAIDKSTNID